MITKKDQRGNFKPEKMDYAYELMREGRDTQRGFYKYEYREMKRALEDIMFMGGDGISF